MRPIIQVRNLSKQYRIGGKKAAYGTLRDSIAGALRNPFRRNGSEENTIWALKDVGFDVMPGEVVGIIGRNGAGKSTLLKILSRITEPTTGEIDIYGRVGSLLEVGTGFHQELSGRENIYLNGAVLGMKRSEIDRKFDEIVDFAEVEKFIDTPVKHYSSGMYMRLAFAVAAHLEPEILIVDEVLAVGDLTFQNKCLGKMEEIAYKGRTVLFVSHNLIAMGKLCSRIMWLENGRVLRSGPSKSTVTEYIATSQSSVNYMEWTAIDSAPGDEYVRLLSVGLFDSNKNQLEKILQDDTFIVSIRYQVLKEMSNSNIGFELKTVDGINVFTSYDIDSFKQGKLERLTGVYRSDCIIPANMLNEGVYYISIAAGIPHVKLSLYCDNVIRVNVGPPMNPDHHIGKMGVQRAGVISPLLEWNICNIE